MLQPLACLAIALGLLASSQPAAACSWSYERGRSPEEIKERGRTDVRRIVGTFHFEEMRGEPILEGEMAGGFRNPEVAGHIERSTGRWETVHYPAREFEDGGCLFPATGPEADATGTFWISRNREDGRYRILAWEGEYAPSAQAVGVGER